MKKIYLVLAVTGLLFVQTVQAQISASAVCGVGLPKGETFGIDGDGGGIGFSYAASVLYHLPNMNNKLGVGIAYNGSLLVGGKADGETLSVGGYGIELYGVKGEYRFFKGKVTPYVGLTTGLSRFEITGLELTSTGDEELDGNADDVASFGFGLAPEIGLDLGVFRLATTYFVPMKYKAVYGDKKSAGVLQFVLGIRYGFGLK
jgi:hypothetical protein